MSALLKRSNAKKKNIYFYKEKLDPVAKVFFFLILHNLSCGAKRQGMKDIIRPSVILLCREVDDTSQAESGCFAGHSPGTAGELFSFLD